MHRLLTIAGALALAAACAKQAPENSQAAAAARAQPQVQQAGQAAVQDSESQKDVVKIAVGSKDHTTLVAALQAADLVNSLANAGPFTVFAPTNAAFDKLPKGTLDDLLKPANKEKLRAILQHHVTVPALDSTALAAGTTLAMADGGKVTITKRGADTFVGDAKILGSVRASNGFVYIVDGVILPR